MAIEVLRQFGSAVSVGAEPPADPAAGWAWISTAGAVLTAAPGASVNDYDFGDAVAWARADLARLNPAADSTVTGLLATYDGHSVLLCNVSAFTVTLACESASSTAANRLAQIASSEASVLLHPRSMTRVVYDGTSARWRLSGELRLTDVGALALPAVAAEPAAPASGLLLYAKSVAGRMLPKIVGPAGIDTVLQAGLHGNSVFMVAPASGTTAPTAWGGTLTTAATMSLQFTAGSTNRWSATSRKRFQTSTTAGNATGMRTAYTQWFRGSAAGFGGFFFRAQLGAQINLAGGQKFVGLCASTGALAGEPSALVNMCGMGYDAADASTGNWQFMRNDGAGAATKVDLGSDAARGTTQGWDLIMFLAPGGSELFVRIVNLNTNATVLDTSYTTDLPAVNTGMAMKAEVRNGAVAAADNLEVAKLYIETDY